MIVARLLVCLTFAAQVLDGCANEASLHLIFFVLEYFIFVDIVIHFVILVLLWIVLVVVCF